MVYAESVVSNVNIVTDVIGPELCGGTKTEKGKAVGWLMALWLA
jgi:hypothetical protein